jgi:hypothetical protein
MRTRYARSRNAIDSPGMPRPPVAKLAMNPTEIATCDITLRQPLTRAVSRLLAAGVVIVLVGPALVGPALGMAYPALPFSLGALLAGLLIWGRASRRIAAQAVARATPPGWSADLLGVVRNVLRRTRWVQPMAALHALLREAARDGAGGTILRLGMPGQLRPLIPLDVPFEPLALDESDETARHLSGARPTQRDDLTWLRVMRNIRLGGGLAVGRRRADAHRVGRTEYLANRSTDVALGRGYSAAGGRRHRPGGRGSPRAFPDGARRSDRASRWENASTGGPALLPQGGERVLHLSRGPPPMDRGRRGRMDYGDLCGNAGRSRIGPARVGVTLAVTHAGDARGLGLTLFENVLDHAMNHRGQLAVHVVGSVLNLSANPGHLVETHRIVRVCDG